MGFTITSGSVGLLGGLCIALIAGAGIIALVIFIAAANNARRDVIEQEHDAGHDDIVA
ncbi:hypothetical protein [Sphingomonas bacterium]|uniref:hypothetical protein n=1 Tax=Sphingomonas bacterium TaxID=1895847 RepID=UPI001575B12C|nr:hypothetical protein [Sphingomonas bacterium]